MQDALIITTAIAVLLFVGVICSWVGKRLGVPDVLLLILTGVIFGRISFYGQPLIDFPEVFLTSLAILALAMIVFDSTTKLRLKDLDTFSLKAVRLVFVTSVMTLIFFTVAATFLLEIPWWSGLLFAAVMVGTSPDVVLSLSGKSKPLTLLKMESIFNTPLTVILPFMVVDLMQNITSGIFPEIIEQMLPFVMKFIVGIGSGVFVAIILFKIVQRVYAEVYSPLAVIVAALLSYVLAENLGGSGVLAVTALGVFFGNVYVKEKLTLLSVESVFAKILYILVFILAGVVLQIPLTKEFFISSGILFFIFLAIRFASVWISFHGDKYTFGELLYMTLVSPKGVATAAVVFILAVKPIPEISLVLDMVFAFILYTIIISSVIIWVTEHHHHDKRTN